MFFGAGATPIMGRNFDFHDEPALLLRHRPPGAFASLSLVDISYLGFDRAHLARDVTMAGLRGASELPFDGMNEKGVAVAMAAVPDARSGAGRAVGSLGVMRLVLDRAANVAEAVAIFRRTAVDFGGGPPLHYLVADASGASAVIEYVRGHVKVHPARRAPVPGDDELRADRRERDRRPVPDAATGALQRSGGRLTARSTLDLLRRVRQPITRWSAAYDLRARTLHVVMGQKYGERALTFAVDPGA